MIRRKQILMTGALVAVVAGVAYAQNPAGAPQKGTMPMKAAPQPAAASSSRPAYRTGADEITFGSNVGSFKVLSYNDETPAKGTLTFSFNGSVLVSGLKGTVTTTGAVRKEYENKEFGKQLYFGKGKITLVGEMRSVQFFGRDVLGKLKGQGLIAFYGEFDNNLDTGWSQYPGKPKTPWGTGGLQRQVPEMLLGPSNNVKIEKSG